MAKTIDLCLVHLEKNLKLNFDKSPLTLGGNSCDLVLNETHQSVQFQVFQRGSDWHIMAMGKSVLKVNAQVVDLFVLKGGENLELDGQLFQLKANTHSTSNKWNMAHFLDEFRHVVLSERMDEILAHLVRISCAVMDADHGELRLQKPQDQCLRWPLDSDFPLSQTMLDRALNTGEIVLWDAKVNAEDYSKSIVRNNLSSIMVLPFLVDAEKVGYLYVQRQDRDHAFDQEDLALFKSITKLLQALVFNVKRKDHLREQIEELQGLHQKGSLMYADEAMAKLVKQIERSAKLPVPVFIYGETGTGKEVMAQYLHQHSDRSTKPFVAINCGAIPENLIESELFGHVKGAFTGAMSDKKGLFEEGQGGTIFLDEIGELPLNVQVKLLRVLQEKKVTPIGSHKEIAIDFRLVSATHVDLDKAVVEGRFREDLLYRINLMTVEIPPLRDRGQDVILLAQHFLDKFSAEYGFKGVRFSKSAEKAMLRHAWSGNVRELINRVQKSLIQGDGESIQPEDLGLSEEKIRPRRTLREAREEAERESVESALQESGGNLTLAGSILGIDRKVLRELMERLGMDKNRYKGAEG